MTVTAIERSALTGTWALDASHTRIGFSAKHAMVATVRGSFGVFDGNLVLDGDNPGQQHGVRSRSTPPASTPATPTATPTCAAATSSTSRRSRSSRSSPARSASTVTTSCSSAT